jgi:hypothetical protein
MLLARTCETNTLPEEQGRIPNQTEKEKLYARNSRKEERRIFTTELKEELHGVHGEEKTPCVLHPKLRGEFLKIEVRQRYCH